MGKEGGGGGRRLAGEFRAPADHFWPPCRAYMQYLSASHSVNTNGTSRAIEHRADVGGPINASETSVWRGYSGAVARKITFVEPA